MSAHRKKLNQLQLQILSILSGVLIQHRLFHKVPSEVGRFGPER